MGLGLQGAGALNQLDELVKERLLEQLTREATAEKIRQFNVGAAERERGHRATEEGLRQQREQRGDVQKATERQHEALNLGRFMEHAMPGEIDPSMATRLRAGGYGGALRTTPERQAEPGAGVLQTSAPESGYPDETPQLYRPERTTLPMGGSRNQMARQSAAEMEARRGAGAEDAAERQQRHDEMMAAMRKAGDQGRPYFTTGALFDERGVPTGNYQFNTRTGQMVPLTPPGGQTRPPPGGGKDVLANETAEAQLARLRGAFKPEFTGPIGGRLRTLGQQVPGVPVNKDFADFSAATSAFRNSVIRAITGAQMSEPEAARIRQQIPEETDKPEVWLSKYEMTKRNLGDLRRAIGRRGVSSEAPSGRIRYDLDGNVIP